MTPTETPPPKPRLAKPGRRVLIPNVAWEMYDQLLKVFEDKPNLRLTYDRGELEIMVPSYEHDGDADFLARMVQVLTEELGLPIRCGGSTTLRKQVKKRGLEPDRCLWIANAAKLAGVRQLDLAVHPPPDLAVEVDVTKSSLDRFKIYAKLGVGELWHLDGDDLSFHVLGARKRYVKVRTTPTFGGITPTDLMQFVINARAVPDENAAVRTFRAWVKQRPPQ